MKRILIITLSLILCMGLLAACKKEEPVETTTEIPETTTKAEETQKETEPEETTTEEPTTEEPTTEQILNNEEISLDPSWDYADFSEINSGTAILYRATENRKGIIIGVNAGHGTEGGASVYTYCHPDMSPKVTGGSTQEGAIKATAVAGGMTFNNGQPEREACLMVAQKLKEKLLEAGYDVLMVRDGDDVQLDNIARTVICNNVADCHIAIHFDGDGLEYDKGCFYISTPEGLKDMDPVASNWQRSEALGECLIEGLENAGFDLYGDGTMPIDLTQTSFSTVPSIDIELGNQCTDLTDELAERYAQGLLSGIENYQFD